MAGTSEEIKYLPLSITKESKNKVAYVQARIQAQKQTYIEGCEKLGTMTGAMLFAGIKSRSTISLWRNSDNDFLAREFKALRNKTETVIDVAESKLFVAIGYGAPWAVKYALDRLSKKYKPKAEIDTNEKPPPKAIEVIVINDREQLKDISDSGIPKEPSA